MTDKPYTPDCYEQITDEDYEMPFHLQAEIERQMNEELASVRFPTDTNISRIVRETLEHDEALPFLLFELDLMDDIDKTDLGHCTSQAGYWFMHGTKEYTMNTVTACYNLGELIGIAAWDAVEKMVRETLERGGWRENRD